MADKSRHELVEEFMLDLCRELGMPTIGPVYCNPFTAKVEIFCLEWAGKKAPLSFIFGATQEISGNDDTLHILDFEKTIIQLTIGSFPY